MPIIVIILLALCLPFLWAISGWLVAAFCLLYLVARDANSKPIKRIVGFSITGVIAFFIVAVFRYHTVFHLEGIGIQNVDQWDNKLAAFSWLTGSIIIVGICCAGIVVEKEKLRRDAWVSPRDTEAFRVGKQVIEERKRAEQRAIEEREREAQMKLQMRRASITWSIFLGHIALDYWNACKSHKGSPENVLTLGKVVSRHLSFPPDQSADDKAVENPEYWFSQNRNVEIIIHDVLRDANLLLPLDTPSKIAFMNCQKLLFTTVGEG